MQGIKLLFVGKTDSPEIQKLMQEYQRRLSRFVPIEVEELPDLKNRKRQEGRLIKAAIGPQDQVVLLDERGKEPTSLQLAKMVEGWQMTVARKLVLVIGGPYGFSDEIYQAYPERLSLSRLTFNHQMVRLFLIEQVYRAYTIIHNHPYHHE